MSRHPEPPIYVYLALLSALFMPCLTSKGQDLPTAAPVQNDWAKDYLQDPLAEVDRPTLEQLQEGLADSQRAVEVLTLHLPRASQITREQKLALLDEAVGSGDIGTRRAAVAVLKDNGLLSELIVQRLRKLALSEDAKLQVTALNSMQELPNTLLPKDDQYIARLIDALRSEDPQLSRAAAEQLRRVGAVAVPELLALLDEMANAEEVATILAAIAADLLKPEEQLGARGSVEDALAPTVIAKGTAESTSQRGSQPQPRGLETGEPAPVRVYFGTNREIRANQEERSSDLWVPFVVIFAIIGVGGWWVWKETIAGRSLTVERRPRWIRVLLVVGGLIAGVLWVGSDLRVNFQARLSQASGPSFGVHRTPDGTIHYGYCDVTIPPSHEIGQVESPQLGFEDEQKHVILKTTATIGEEAYFEMLRQRLQEVDGADSCFVFIHGYNVDFEAAAKRTAQIYYDLDFKGLPIFYSWPSRGSLRHYFSDRNEVIVSRELIKRFLIQVAERSNARHIHVIAHSMGADAVTQAIASIEGEEILFDQIILAAPDIDAELFKQQLLPRLRERGKRTTLYCSENDLALYMSRHFNDSWRAGDSSQGVLIATGLDTIDASRIDTDLLGHSYYGDCLPLLRDFRELMLRNSPPQDRALILVPSGAEIPAWTFPMAIGN